ncbi:MAG TPA: SDR family oxidoreductase, partial [Vicinamibacterales bacterium]|nr:SDR family oxidoreductase [Vicinamibacterales bacterium]
GGPIGRRAERSMGVYLVTGGAGFIGSHLVDALVARGERVRVADNFSTGRRENLAHLTGIEIVEGDLADLDVARRAVEGCEIVLHQAAMPSVPRSVEDPIASNRANVDATLNVLVAARDAGVRRVVYAGSSSAYGNLAALPKREDMPPAPLSPYALQKLVGEQYARLFWELYGLETVTIRYFNVFGPRQSPSSPYSGVISLFIAALVEGRRPTIYGDGEQTRDFTYVANVVDGVLRACEAPQAVGQVINVATGGRISLNRLFQALRELTGADVEPVYADPRPGDVRDSQADISRARALLGYEPIVSFEEGLRRTLAWYRSTRAGTTAQPSPSARPGPA